MFNDAKNLLPKPKGSFNQRVQPPAADPTTGPLVAVCFSEAWLPVVLGALDQLLLSYTWIGSYAEIQLAQDRAQMLKDIFSESVCAAAPESVPTPYWAEDEDVEDTAPVDIQTWYGHTEGNNFVQDAADFVLQGFIAVGISPQAAIAYRTFVPRMRVAFRRGEFGGLVNIFVDGVKAIGIDTFLASGSDVKEIALVIDPEADVLPDEAEIMIASVT